MDDELNVGSVNDVNTEENKINNNNNNDEFRKKILKIVTIIVGIAILFLIILFIVSLFFKKNYTYSELENLLKDSAIKFYSENKKELPKSEGHIVMIKSSTLIDAGYMKDFSSYTKKNISCTGTVTVQKSGKEYVYTPKLDCGSDYTTISLKDKIIKKQGVITTGDGLYNLNNSYVFRGENVNNYLQLDNRLWRIVKINNDDTIQLILNNKMKQNIYWDNRYNIEMKYISGINDYSKSRIYDRLIKYYNSTNKDPLLSEDDKTKLTKFNACISKRDASDTSRDGSVECSQILENQNISLLPAYDYMNASIDPNCTKILSVSCQNYNYLVTDFEWWLATASLKNTTLVFGVNDGVVSSSNASNYKGVRPVVYLKSDILYVSGNGTETNPYKVR